MAVEKEKLLNDLKVEVGENNFSDRTWGTIADNYVTDAPEDATEYGKFIKKHATILKGMQGQFNHDVSDSVSKQVEAKMEEYKKKHPEKPVETPPENKNDEPDKNKENTVEKELEELKKWKEDVEKEKTEQATKKIVDEKRVQIMAKLKEEGCDNKEILEFVELKLTVDKDTSIEDLIKNGKEIYDDKYKKLFGGTYTPGASNSAPVSKEKANKNLKEFRENLKKINSKK